MDITEHILQKKITELSNEVISNIGIHLIHSRCTWRWGLMMGTSIDLEDLGSFPLSLQLSARPSGPRARGKEQPWPTSNTRPWDKSCEQGRWNFARYRAKTMMRATPTRAASGQSPRTTIAILAFYSRVASCRRKRPDFFQEMMFARFVAISTTVTRPDHRSGLWETGRTWSRGWAWGREEIDTNLYWDLSRKWRCLTMKKFKAGEAGEMGSDRRTLLDSILILLGHKYGLSTVIFVLIWFWSWWVINRAGY